MATLEQASIYNTARGNTAWATLNSPLATALLQDAEDYIRSVYPVRSGLTADEQRLFDGIVCRLASIFQTKPVQVAAAAAIKSEKKEGAGFKKEVEYADAGSDPYPYVTAVVRPLLVSTGTGGFTIGRLVR
jgi:hypothetical protein